MVLNLAARLLWRQSIRFDIDLCKTECFKSVAGELADQLLDAIEFLHLSHARLYLSEINISHPFLSLDSGNDKKIWAVFFTFLLGQGGLLGVLASGTTVQQTDGVPIESQDGRHQFQLRPSTQL